MGSYTLSVQYVLNVRKWGGGVWRLLPLCVWIHHRYISEVLLVRSS